MDNIEVKSTEQTNNDAILTYFKKKKTESGQLRYNFEKNWYRNILFYIGKQWIKYDNSKRLWTNVDLPSWFPTPVTNKFASTMDTVMSVLNKVTPNIVASPVDDNIDNVNSAEIARIILDIITEESGFEKEKQLLHTWLTLCGDTYIYTYYDNDIKNGVIEIDEYKCNNCGYIDDYSKFIDNICPNCGSNLIEKTGNKKTYPKGKIKCRVLSPFEVFVDMNIKKFEDMEYVLIAKTLTEDQIKNRWENVELKNTDNTELGMQFFNSLAYITNVADLASQGIGQFYSGQQRLNTVWELFIKPNKDFPNGWHGFICNNKILEGGDLEYIDANGVRFIPIVHFSFIDVPKRFYSKTIADDLVYKQIQRNKLESFIQLAAHRTSNPVWLVPNTAGVQKITGEPGEIVRFNDSNTAHGVPTRLPGVELTQSVFRWLEIIDKDFEELASTFDIIKGNVPPNVPTLGGLELLEDRGLSRFGRMIKNIENSLIKMSYQWLWIWKQFATEDRIVSVKDSNNKWKFKSFNNSDLNGNVDLRIEPGSSNPRSEGYKQYVTGQLLGYGLIDVGDPIVRHKILRLFHASDIDDTLNIDIEYAERENNGLLEGNIPILKPEIDNHEIHIAVHLKFCKLEQYNKVPDNIKEMFEIHIKEHKNMMTKQMMNANIAQQGLETNKTSNVNKAGVDSLLSAKGGQQIGIETSQIENQGGL